MEFLIAVVLNFLTMVNNENTVDTESNKTVEAYSNVAVNEERNRYEGKKLKKYSSEEILCSLADSLWDQEKHDEIINSLKDKDIKLTGTVNRVRNTFEGCYVVFTQKRADGMTDGWAMITCYFRDEEQKEKVMKLKKGDNITIVGHFTKYPVIDLSMYDCYLK